MIQADLGKIRLNGDVFTLKAEFVGIIASLKDNGFTKEEIEHCTEVAFMSEEEMKRIEQDMKKEFRKIMKEVISGLDEKEKEDLFTRMFEDLDK